MYNTKKKLKNYHKIWYEKNKNKRIAQIHVRQKELSLWLQEYKSNLKCEKCPESHPFVLDFHHIDSSKKDVDISRAINRGWSKERILKEISKCQILCSNCHRKLHWSMV